MSRFLLFGHLIFLLFSTACAQANIEIKFTESAPTDEFSVHNRGQCHLKNLTVDIDLAKSAGKLIFDTIGDGPGENVYQPFVITQGRSLFELARAVNDGDTGLSLKILSLAPDAKVSFTIDVDDTLPISELRRTRVTGAEIENGLVSITNEDSTVFTGYFNSRSQAKITIPPCST